MMITRTIALLAILAGIAVLIFTYGHKRGRRSCRNEYPDGWDAGQKAERDWWEHAAGITRAALARWQARDQDPEPPGEWPYGFRTDLALPATEVLLAEADAALGKDTRVPSVAEVDEMAAQRHAAHGHGEFTRELADDFRSWQHRQDMPPERLGDEWDRIHPGWRQHTGREPVVADITDAARWRPFSDEPPTITGTIIAPDRSHDPGADWDLLAGSALPDYAAAALGGHRTVDECVDSIVMRAVGR